MAFKSATVANVYAADRPMAHRLPIDLNHLHRQTLGDRHLQCEVLKMFLRQARDQIARLNAAELVEERRETAHSLVGSARGIGAFPIAAIAAEIEFAKGPVVGRIKALEAAAVAARVFIEDHLAA